jgi:hypothetical protein
MAGGAVIFIGAKNSGNDESLTLNGDGLVWTEIFDSDDISLGLHLTVDLGTWPGTSIPSITNKSFVLSGSAATSYGKSFILTSVSEADEYLSQNAILSGSATFGSIVDESITQIANMLDGITNTAEIGESGPDAGIGSPNWI